MTDLRQAAQQALEALERVMSHGQAVEQAKEGLRAALAEPERKPLSEDEIIRLMVGEARARLMLAGKEDPEFLRFAEDAIRELVESARAIERAHGIKEQVNE